MFINLNGNFDITFKYEDYKITFIHPNKITDFTHSILEEYFIELQNKFNVCKISQFRSIFGPELTVVFNDKNVIKRLYTVSYEPEDIIYKLQ
jgi:hypothetical protein